jgi:hypothetical protein
MLANVKVERVREQVLPRLLTATGKVQFNEDQTARVLAPLPGQVLDLRARVGDTVAKDAVLFLCVPGPLLVIGAHLPLIKTWAFDRPQWASCRSSCARSRTLQISHWPIFTSAPASPPGKTLSKWCSANEAEACGVMPSCTKLM